MIITDWRGYHAYDAGIMATIDMLVTRYHIYWCHGRPAQGPMRQRGNAGKRVCRKSRTKSQSGMKVPCPERLPEVAYKGEILSWIPSATCSHYLNHQPNAIRALCLLRRETNALGQFPATRCDIEAHPKCVSRRWNRLSVWAARCAMRPLEWRSNRHFPESSGCRLRSLHRAEYPTS